MRLGIGLNSEIIKAGKQIYPINSVKNVIRRLKFLLRAKRKLLFLQQFVNTMVKQGDAAVFENHPHVLGAVEWPYIHKDWTVEKRLNSILQHYSLVKTQPNFLHVLDKQAKQILDLHEYSPNSYLSIDRPAWFAREGEIVLSLFKELHRINSIAFTLSKLNNDLIIYIGAIQGITASEDSLTMFKAITKDFEGLRPTSFMIEIIRMLANKIGVKKILAISDTYRHHHHAYFKGSLNKMLITHYNDTWIDHQGEELDNGFYLIPVAEHRRNIADISSNKRAMYKRRYQMLNEIKQSISLLN